MKKENEKEGRRTIENNSFFEIKQCNNNKGVESTLSYHI